MAPNKSFSWTQFFPPKPRFSAQDMPNLQGKVYVVTGGNSGMGKELAQALYAKNAKVYLTYRIEEKGSEAIKDIKRKVPASKRKLVFLHLELANLKNVRAAAKTLLSRESNNKLHGLFNNVKMIVGPAEPPTKTAQGYEEAIGVNCIGTFLFTKLLTPALIAAARSEPADTVRVVWLSSFGLEQFAPEGGAIDMSNLDFHNPKPGIERYGLSKVGTWLVAINPGNIRTALARHQGAALKLIAGAIVYPVKNGVSAQLFTGFSKEITTKFDWKTEWVIPFGRIARLRPDLTQATLPTTDGGNGSAQVFWEWNEQQVKDYLE
ncbi:putative estradiol 17 beta-dehydrogenase [Daldinia caldariorum]|uniref:putative estradiol 17 beta-dehydrogenase n=1 Tax=Daldinia caldariorum TaxID=326644 RepID=UPI0020085107|nr:putative estradiol 17 beta-dehydrogenase [Daldinia caldariorum]KAI1466227.1 putative estradiol 17 beta-dehydrogenase [Daldinia caldariorum]